MNIRFYVLSFIKSFLRISFVIIVLFSKANESKLKVLFFRKLLWIFLRIFLRILLGISFVIIVLFSKAKES